MNILYYLSTFPKLQKSYVLNEIYELERRGHDVAVCALYEPDEEIVHEEYDELEIPITYLKRPTYSDATELLSTKVLRPEFLKNARYPAPPWIHAANLFHAKQCLEFVESLDWEPDHVHAHFSLRSRFPAKFVSTYYGVPFTITAHAFDLYGEPVGPYTSTLLRSCDRIITISEYNERQIRDRFAPETPIDVVRAGISLEKFSPTDRTMPNRILSTSRFVEKKGLTYALEAVALVAEELPDLEYHIIGHGELEDSLVRQTQRLGIEANVTFLGKVSDRRLIAELDVARVFLLPCVVAASGDRDGIPVAMMEAMAMETPPVSTTVSGIPELVDHELTGLLTDPRDPEATAHAVLALLREDSEWAAYSKEARQKVSAAFNIEKEVEKLETTFEKTSLG